MLKNTPFFEFIKAALGNPFQISTLFQTSHWLREQILNGAKIENVERVCELGPGAGAITSGIVKRLKSLSGYVGIELNTPLVQFLRSEYPNLTFVEGSAELCTDVAAKNGAFDVVISSLPWTMFDPALQDKILSAVHQSLKPGGLFCTYVCLNASWLPTAKSLKNLLIKNFTSVNKSDIEWRNIPPAFIYFCRK